MLLEELDRAYLHSGWSLRMSFMETRIFTREP